MREKAIYLLHDESNHFCHTKTLDRVQDQYFWSEMSVDVKRAKIGGGVNRNVMRCRI